VQFVLSHKTVTLAPFATGTLVPPDTNMLIVCPPVVRFLTGQVNFPVFGTNRLRVAVSVTELVTINGAASPLISG
jgi:hypothetical protein